ncbi:MAG TPA: glycoside hydrolase family 15 protein [Acidimicrobiales bacterium]|nr:glycoside hydrolase family 15 protein [Acidimicrobiales bacterium]
MNATHRVHGFAPIEDYAVLGDGRTVALIALDGSVDWWALPTLDSPPVLSGLLDPDGGGRLSLAPSGDYQVTRRYLDDTNVVETVYNTGTGAARVTAALNVGSAGRLPWAELAQRIDVLAGFVDLSWSFTPGDRFGRANPWVSDRGGTPVASIEDQTLGVIVDGLPPGVLTPHSVSGQGRLYNGDRALLAVVATDTEPLFIPAAGAIQSRLDRTVGSWRRWAKLLPCGGPWQPAVRRSALALKTLLAEHSGAIAAAATTSLPERVGGAKNWDYRYAWVRDSSFTLDALINLGLHEEVHGAVSWLLSAIRDNGGDLRVFYRLDGTTANQEEELDIPGWRCSQPVRSGNSASGQTQLGTYGDLFDTISRYCAEGHLIDPATGRMLADLADRCCDRWRHRDSGIWELKARRHYTISKIGCWVALDRAVQLAESAQVPGLNAERWRAGAEEIRTWVNENCWSDAKQAYTFYAGTDDLDAAVLLAGRTGFERGPRLTSTIEAIANELGHGPLLYRYTGMNKEEGAFVACSFWMVDALARTGQTERGRQLMDDTVALVNDVGLLSEQINPDTGAFLGNMPQGLSHLALINAAFALERAGHCP